MPWLHGTDGPHARQRPKVICRARLAVDEAREENEPRDATRTQVQTTRLWEGVAGHAPLRIAACLCLSFRRLTESHVPQKACKHCSCLRRHQHPRGRRACCITVTSPPPPPLSHLPTAPRPSPRLVSRHTRGGARSTSRTSPSCSAHHPRRVNALRANGDTSRLVVTSSTRCLQNRPRR